jgi:hypothetical protein
MDARGSDPVWTARSSPRLCDCAEVKSSAGPVCEAIEAGPEYVAVSTAYGATSARVLPKYAVRVLGSATV